MRKTGTITNIQSKGPFQSQHGQLYKFEMVINCNGDIVVGEINSKSQQYPKQVGQEICVDIVVNDYGTQLKNVNVEYQGQQQSQQGTSQPRQSNKAEPDWDLIALGKCRSLIVQAAVTSLQMECKSFDDVDRLVQYMIHGQKGQQAFEKKYDLPPDNVHQEDY